MIQLKKKSFKDFKAGCYHIPERQCFVTICITEVPIADKIVTQEKVHLGLGLQLLNQNCT